ncbi:MAG: 30S ribosomal protein S12 methylthiotransferase RimO [Bilophila sp.]
MLSSSEASSRALRCYSTSLGCPKNRVDTERLLGSLGVDLIPVDEPEDAELVFVNTCAFIQPATEESVRTLAQIIADIEDLPKRPLLAVAGCLVGRYSAKELAPELPEVDLWLDNSDLERWPLLLARALGLPENAPAGRLLSTGPSYAWLKVSDGCRHACSFCTIPSIRGKHRSHPKDMLVREARFLLDQGVKELDLVAQDLSAWGEDLGTGQDLRTLLDGLLPLSGLERLRLLYLYPAGVTMELLHYLRDAGSPFVPYFDVPVQHANAAILSRMGRPFARNPREVVDRIRSVFPDAVLRTTLIVGFPGETDEQYQELCSFVEETQFQHLGVFAYRAEEGTPAAAMPDQIEDRVKEWRRDALMELQTDISARWLAQFENERLPILVDAPHPDWPGLHTGRAWFQAPEIDGLTYISGPGVTPGALVSADIVECRDYDLVALA